MVQILYTDVKEIIELALGTLVYKITIFETDWDVNQVEYQQLILVFSFYYEIEKYSRSCERQLYLSSTCDFIMLHWWGGGGVCVLPCNLWGPS